jgi:hypothetical protein
MARSEKFEEYVGRLPQQTFINNVAGMEGHWRGINYEGEMVRVGYARSKLAGWWIWVSVSEQAVQNSLREALWTLAALGAVLTLLALFIAYLFGGRLAGTISTLALQAAALGRGELIYAKGLPVREINDVDGQLVAASEQRKGTERQLVRKLPRKRTAVSGARARGHRLRHLYA